METIDKTIISCDICYKEITNKVILECKHELCVMCFLEVIRSLTTWSKGQITLFKCHMCRKQYNWTKEVCDKVLEETLEETLSVLIREDEGTTLSFQTLVGMETSKVFEVIVQEQHVIQFVVILGSQMDTETLKFLISEFIANNVPFPFSNDNLMQNLRRPAAFGHFKNTGIHLESFYDNLVIKKYED